MPAPLHSHSNAHSRDCWQGRQPGEWSACVVNFQNSSSSARTPPQPSPSTFSLPLPSSLQPRFPLRVEQRTRERVGFLQSLGGSLRVMWQPLVWDGFNKILVRGTGMNHDDFPRMLLIIPRPRIYKQQSRPPLRGSGERESWPFPWNWVYAYGATLCFLENDSGRRFN